MKMILLSFTDSTNIGDQFIVEQLEKRLENLGEIITYSYNFKKNFLPIECDSYVEENRNNIQKNLKLVLQKVSFIDKINSKRIIKRIKNKVADSSFENDLKEVDVLIIGGGNTIFDLTKFADSAGKFELIVNMAKNYNKKIVFMDIGIGPFVTIRQAMKAQEVLKLADYITVRDQASYNLIRELKNVELGIDPVFSMENNNIVRNYKNTACIGICIIDYTLNKATKKEFLKYLDDTKNLILKIKKEQPNCKFLIFNSEIRDFEAVSTLKKLLNGYNLEIKYEFIGSKKQLLNLYKNLDIVIGTRMHSMIIAISQGIPVIGISWQPKVTEIFKMFNDEKSVFDIKTFEKQLDVITAILSEKLKGLENNSAFMRKIIEERTQVDLKLLNNIVGELSDE